MMTAVVAGAFAAVAIADDPRPSPDIARLIEQLGSDDYELREEATKALAKLGPAALPALEAAAEGGHPEAARRAATLVPTIRRRADSGTLLASRTIRLTYKNTPLAIAVADLKDRTGIPLVLDPDAIGDMVRPVTCETPELPVWEAVSEFCRAAGLLEVFEFELEAPKPPANRTYHFTPTRTAADAVPLVLVDGAQQPLPGSRSHAVRVLALPASFPGHRVMLGSGEVEFCLDVTPTPGLNWQDAPAVRVTRVIDDEGRIGGAGSPPPAPRFDPLAPNGPRMAAFDNSGSPPWPRPLPNPRIVRVPLRVATPSARSLRVLEGSVIGEVQVPGQTLATIHNPVASLNRSASGPNNLRVSVLAVETTGDRVRVKLQSQTPSPWLARLRQNNGAGGVPWPEPPRAEGMSNQWKAFDSTGHPIAATASDLLDIRDDGETLTTVLQLHYPRDRGVPAKLCVVGPRRVIVELPFRLENVPLP